MLHLGFFETGLFMPGVDADVVMCHFILSVIVCFFFFTFLFQGQGMLPYFANFRLLAEFSTPCVNQR